MQRRRREKKGGTVPPPPPSPSQLPAQGPGRTKSHRQTEEDPIPAYRNSLMQAYNKIQDSYDKTLITLSSGSLAVSISFMKNIMGHRRGDVVELLKTAWAAWGLSFILVLVSYITGYLALKQAIMKVNTSTALNIPMGVNQPMGGKAENLTLGLNFMGGILYIIGIVLFMTFVIINWK